MNESNVVVLYIPSPTHSDYARPPRSSGPGMHLSPGLAQLETDTNITPLKFLFE